MLNDGSTHSNKYVKHKKKTLSRTEIKNISSWIEDGLQAATKNIAQLLPTNDLRGYLGSVNFIV